jgi:peptide/nickel transport system substrate-binding protein
MIGLAFALLCACAKTTGLVDGHNPWTIPGVVRLGEQQEPDSLNLMFGENAATDEVSALLFSFILRFNANGKLLPDLATVVPTQRNGGISKDGRTITVHLRKGVVWSDGAPLTAADWLFTYHAVMNPRNDTKTRYGWDDIASASAPNPYTLVIHLKRPSVAAFNILTMAGAAYPPLPAHLLAKLPDLNHATFNTAPISSGPFLLKSWSHGASLVFVPNPRYWRGPPHLKELIWKVVPDSNTLLSELQTHAIDLYPNVDTNAIRYLGEIRGIRVLHRTVANWRGLGINMKQPLLADVRVRRALALAIDWKRLNDTVYGGYNQLAVSDIYPGSWAAPSLPPYRYDPALARRLLAQAGWHLGSDGVLRKGTQQLRLTISATTTEKSNEQAEVVMQSMLRRVGIALSIRNYPSDLFFALNGPLYTGKYDLEWSIDTNGPDPDNAASWNSAFIPPNGANTSWLRDPIVDATSNAAHRTFDQSVRRALYQREEERLRKLVPEVFFYWETSYYAINSDFKHFKPSAYNVDTWNSWQWSI